MFEFSSSDSSFFLSFMPSGSFFSSSSSFSLRFSPLFVGMPKKEYLAWIREKKRKGLFIFFFPVFWHPRALIKFSFFLSFSPISLLTDWLTNYIFSFFFTDSENSIKELLIREEGRRRTKLQKQANPSSLLLLLPARLSSFSCSHIGNNYYDYSSSQPSPGEEEEEEEIEKTTKEKLPTSSSSAPEKRRRRRRVRNQIDIETACLLTLYLVVLKVKFFRPSCPKNPFSL